MNGREVVKAHLKIYEKMLVDPLWAGDEGVLKLVKNSIQTLKLVLEEMDEIQNNELEEMYNDSQG